MWPNIIAIGIILIITTTIIVCFKFRAKPLSKIFRMNRLLLLLIVIISMSVVLNAIFVNNRNIDDPAPISHILSIVICCIIFISVVVDRINILIPCCLFVFAVGILLQYQFESLAYTSAEYCAVDKYTNKFMPKRRSYNVNTFDVVAIKLWHSWFTGIYKINKR